MLYDGCSVLDAMMGARSSSIASFAWIDGWANAFTFAGGGGSKLTGEGTLIEGGPLVQSGQLAGGHPLAGEGKLASLYQNFLKRAQRQLASEYPHTAKTWCALTATPAQFVPVFGEDVAGALEALGGRLLQEEIVDIINKVEVDIGNHRVDYVQGTEAGRGGKPGSGGTSQVAAQVDEVVPQVDALVPGRGISSSPPSTPIILFATFPLVCDWHGIQRLMPVSVIIRTTAGEDSAHARGARHGSERGFTPAEVTFFPGKMLFAWESQATITAALRNMLPHEIMDKWAALVAGLFSSDQLSNDQLSSDRFSSDRLPSASSSLTGDPMSGNLSSHQGNFSANQAKHKTDRNQAGDRQSSYNQVSGNQASHKQVSDGRSSRNQTGGNQSGYNQVSGSQVSHNQAGDRQSSRHQVNPNADLHRGDLNYVGFNAGMPKATRSVISGDGEILEILDAVTQGLTKYYGGVFLDGSAGAMLEPCVIPKPWGREIWYTGIEKRGVSRIKSLSEGFAKSLDSQGTNLQGPGQGGLDSQGINSQGLGQGGLDPQGTNSQGLGQGSLNSQNKLEEFHLQHGQSRRLSATLPLSLPLQMASLLRGSGVPFMTSLVEQSPVLLKVLDPFPDEDYGNLYYELHEEKSEVYVISNIASTGATAGKIAGNDRKEKEAGTMQLGFAEEKRKEYESFSAFKKAFSQAIGAYREVRMEIDGRLDKERVTAGIALNAEMMPEQLRQWTANIPKSLREREARLRREMEAFIGKLSLNVGDVVTIPPKVPHSLQHGVRTVEFQTPVYERLIIAFNQKTLTQAHWDTDKAFSIFNEAWIKSAQQSAILRAASKLRATSKNFDDQGQGMGKQGSKRGSLGIVEQRIADFAGFTVDRVEVPPGMHQVERAIEDCIFIYGLTGKFDLRGRAMPSGLILRSGRAFCLFYGGEEISVTNQHRTHSALYLRAVAKTGVVDSKNA